MRIALIDYGAGNLTSVLKALRHLGASVAIPAAPADLGGADAVVVPGVGHFGATSRLDATWREAVWAAVEGGRPLLGICLGMQWLFEGSDEAPRVPGLGVMSGCCARVGSAALGGDAEPTAGGRSALKVPHVGWNTLRRVRPSRLLEGIPDGAYVYFTHSYAAPVGPDAVATTTYGGVFAAAVERGPVCGVQFHPEKSGEVGLQVLRNFLALATCGAW
jgi:glutamine amidotransferase